MGRSRYKIINPTKPHFITCTITHWIPIFTRKESVDIIRESLKYLQTSDGLKIHAYVILENHLHLIVSSDNLPKTIQKFKSFTAKEILSLLKINKVYTILEQLAFYKKAHRRETSYQLWQEGYQPKEIINEDMLKDKIDYMHQNPVKRGYVENPTHWLNSSARD